MDSDRIRIISVLTNYCNNYNLTMLSAGRNASKALFLPTKEILEYLAFPLTFVMGIAWISVITLIALLVVDGTRGTGMFRKASQISQMSQISQNKSIISSTVTIVDPHKDRRSKEGESKSKREILLSILKRNPFKTAKELAVLIPTRFRNFFIDAFLIPSHRPEWGKYQQWSYRDPEVDSEHVRRKRASVQIQEPAPTLHNHAECARVKFSVNGRIFETQRRTLKRFPTSMLGNSHKRAKYYDPIRDCYFFDRTPASFEAILYFFQSGGYLRRPENVHVDTFLDDLKFYGLPDDVVDNFKLDEGLTGEVVSYENELPKNLLQRKIWLLFEYPESSAQARILGYLSVLVVILSIVTLCLSSVAMFRSSGPGVIDEPHLEETEIVDLRNPFFFTETVCSTWFTVEYLMRLMTCPDHWDFIKGWQNVIDFMSILPFYFQVISAEATKTDQITILRTMRLLRVFRIFKLSRHSIGLKVLGLTLKSSIGELALLVFFVFLGVIMFSTCMFFIEGSSNPDSPYQSIPHGFWWAVCTMTTVGFGDVVPLTSWGRLVGAFCALSGVLTIALPVPVIVANFNYYYHQYMHANPTNGKLDDLQYQEDCPFRPGGEEEKELMLGVDLYTEDHEHDVIHGDSRK